MSPKLLLPILILVPLAVLALVFFPSFLSPLTDVQVTTQNSQPNTPLPAEAQTKTGVTVSANYLSNNSSAEFIVFQISLNTHSVDLDNIDFQKSVILEKSGQEFSPIEVAAEGSGHHRSAEVKFNRTSPPFKIIFLDTPEVNQQEFEFTEL